MIVTSEQTALVRWNPTYVGHEIWLGVVNRFPLLLVGVIKKLLLLPMLVSKVHMPNSCFLHAVRESLLLPASLSRSAVCVSIIPQCVDETPIACIQKAGLRLEP